MLLSKHVRQKDAALLKREYSFYFNFLLDGALMFLMSQTISSWSSSLVLPHPLQPNSFLKKEEKSCSLVFLKQPTLVHKLCIRVTLKQCHVKGWFRLAANLLQPVTGALHCKENGKFSNFFAMA